MDATFHRFTELFAQLGLPTSPEGIAQFLKQHRLPPNIALADAPFWNPAQAALLREQWLQDGDWADVVDHLNTALRN